MPSFVEPFWRRAVLRQLVVWLFIVELIESDVVPTRYSAELLAPLLAIDMESITKSHAAAPAVVGVNRNRSRIARYTTHYHYSSLAARCFEFDEIDGRKFCL